MTEVYAIFKDNEYYGICAFIAGMAKKQAVLKWLDWRAKFEETGLPFSGERVWEVMEADGFTIKQCLLTEKKHEQ